MKCKICKVEVTSTHHAAVHQERTFVKIYGSRHSFHRSVDGYFHCYCDFMSKHPASLSQHLKRCPKLDSVRSLYNKGALNVEQCEQISFSSQNSFESDTLSITSSDMSEGRSNASQEISTTRSEEITAQPLITLANIAASSPYLEFDLVVSSKARELKDQSNLYNISNQLTQFDFNVPQKSLLAKKVPRNTTLKDNAAKNGGRVLPAKRNSNSSKLNSSLIRLVESLKKANN